jgi:cation diffusion facilitator family transporter
MDRSEPRTDAETGRKAGHSSPVREAVSSGMREPLTGYVWLSIGAAIVTISLKALAYFLTGSVGLLSDALESVVNLTAAVLALLVIRIAEQPPDEEHAFGHEKAEYFAGGAEGTLIILAALTVFAVAVYRLFNPQPLTSLDLGLSISVVASLINFATARILMGAGRRNRSIALEADAQHLMTDVWTSVGVLTGIAAVAVTGWQRLDPFIAIAVAVHISWTGSNLIRKSYHGLMDASISTPQLDLVIQTLETHAKGGIKYHALRTRQAGARSFISLHIQVPGNWSVQKGHDLAETIESEIRKVVPAASVSTHIEPIEDPRSWQDEHLEDLTGRAQTRRRKQ